MSLLEDVFLQDEADEAQELERVIEGDEYDERPRPSTPNSDENSEKEDEAEEDKRRVDPTKAKEKRVVRNPRMLLNPARLTGPRGIQIIPDHFKDFKFKGKGHEKDDLDLVLKKLEHWAYRLFPKFQFEDCLKKIETLGKKKPVMVHLHKIRTDQFMSEETVVQRDSSDDELPMPPEDEDEFDKLLQQQIDLARVTPAPGSVKKGFETPQIDNRPSFLMPKVTSSPSISDEQRERMLKNRRLAEERRLAKLKQNTTNETVEAQTSSQDIESHNHNLTTEISEIDEDIVAKKNKSNVIDSSDDESDMITVNESVTVDIHCNVDQNHETEIAEDEKNLTDMESNEIILQDNTGIVDAHSNFNENSDKDSRNTDTVKDTNNMSIPEVNEENNENEATIPTINLSTEDTRTTNDDNHGGIIKSIENKLEMNNVMADKTADNERFPNEDINVKEVENKDNDEGDELNDIMDVDFSEEF